jgi:hypothetical protein
VISKEQGNGDPRSSISFVIYGVVVDRLWHWQDRMWHCAGWDVALTGQNAALRDGMLY